jgi:hypothetical protein
VFVGLLLSSLSLLTTRHNRRHPRAHFLQGGIATTPSLSLTPLIFFCSRRYPIRHLFEYTTDGMETRSLFWRSRRSSRCIGGSSRLWKSCSWRRALLRAEYPQLSCFLGVIVSVSKILAQSFCRLRVNN